MPIAIFERLARHCRHDDRQQGRSIAAMDGGGQLDYPQLMRQTEAVARALLAGRASLEGARIGLWMAPGRHFPAALLGIWRAGGLAVPLALSHPEPELEHTLRDSSASAVLAEGSIAERLHPVTSRLGVAIVEIDPILASPAPPSATPSSDDDLPQLTEGDPALLIYTSGTTGRPKGVVLDHGNLAAHMACLHQAWAWTAEDKILEVLPLHHVHGLVNVMCCSLWAGATCYFLPHFEAAKVWRCLVEQEPTLFMAVPTIYVRLIEAWEAATKGEQETYSAAARRLRLMVSGSAALPVKVLERWREITGHTLLERYGMSEIGMALSNPLVGDRLAGTVGRPLPGVDLRLVDGQARPVDDGEPGEVEIRGAGVFSRYWQRPDATREAFRDGWFRTGDVAIRGGPGQPEGVYRLLGRSSVDILKSGGEKISALEIEAVLRQHPAIGDCAVVGLPDPTWGQRVAVAIEPPPRPAGAEGGSADGQEGPGSPLDLEALREWARQRLAPYKLPTRLRVVESLPRNALGKVQKPRVAELFDTSD